MDLEPMTQDDLDEATAGTTDLSGMSDEELDVQISQVLEEEPEPEAPAPAEKPEPEPEPEAAGPEPEPEKAGEPTETPDETPPEPTPEDDEREELRAEMEIQRAKMDKINSQMEHYKYLADNRAGELDYLRRQGPRAAAPQQPAPVSEDYGEPTGTAEVPRALLEKVDALERGQQEERTERITRALAYEAAEFQLRNADFFNTLKEQGEDEHRDLMAEVGQRVAVAEKEFESLLYGDNAKLSVKTARMIYDSSLADAREAYYGKRRELIRSRRAAQAEKMREAKQDAAVTDSAPKASPTPSKAKTLSELDDADLERLLDKGMKDGVFDGAS